MSWQAREAKTCLLEVYRQAMQKESRSKRGIQDMSLATQQRCSSQDEPKANKKYFSEVR